MSQDAARELSYDLSQLPYYRVADDGAEGGLELAVASPSLMTEGRREFRLRVLRLVAVLAAVGLLSSMVVTGAGQLVLPSDVLECYRLWLRQAAVSAIAPFDRLTADELLAVQPFYREVTARFGMTVLAAAAGAMAGVAGLLFQRMAHRPSMPVVLCVSSAGLLGDAVLSAVFPVALGASAFVAGGARAALYLVGVVAAVFAWRVRTGRAPSAFSQHVDARMAKGCAVLYALVWVACDIVMRTFGIGADVAAPAVPAAFTALLLVGFAPVVALRFRLNGLAYSAVDVRGVGIDADALETVAGVCGVALLAGAQLACGAVALAAFAVPGVGYRWFGGDFRRNLIGCALMGAIAMCACSAVAGVFPVSPPLPAGAIANAAALAAMAAMAIRGRSPRAPTRHPERSA